MTRRVLTTIIVLGLGFAAASCSKEAHPGLGAQDSLLVTPLKAPKDTTPGVTSEGQVPIDSVAVQQQRDEAKLERFSPVEVVGMYRAYQPLRNDKTTKEQLNAFLKAYKITEDELHAMLAVGDRLGWAPPVPAK